MTSQIRALEKNEILKNSSNGRARGDTANKTQLVTQSSSNQKTELTLQQNAQQRERLALLGTTAVVFAHEVGNALQAIFGTLELVETEFKRRQVADPLLTSIIQGAMRETDRLRELLGEFRSLAKAQDLDLQVADLPKIIGDVLALQKLRHQAAGVTVKLDCQSHLPPVMLDAAKITQVVLNLCKNAVEAMPNGGALWIRVYPVGSMIVMEIADSGGGVPDDVNIFQLFETTKSGGSGLGLPVVQQIVFAHKGTIDYITEPGRGTTFTVKFPAEKRY